VTRRTRLFNGRRYSLDGIYSRDSARNRAEALRFQGKRATLTPVGGYGKAGNGKLIVRWAVYTRGKK
jgi:hypothetical protein